MWKKFESGQSLLVIVLLISIVFTIIATASYRLTTETQSTRLQEESIKTLAAADSGIERGVNLANTTAETAGKVTYLSLGITAPGVDSTKSTLQVTATEGPQFMSPLVSKDEQYTYFLYEYPTGTTSINNDVNVFFANSAGCASPTAVEITLIYGPTGTGVRRWIADPCNSVPTPPSVNELTVGTGITIDGITVQRSVRVPTTAAGVSNQKLLIVRVIGTASNLGFTRFGGGTLYSQGQLIRSEAVSTNGVTKIVTLFKSYPQIPADFFATRF